MEERVTFLNAVKETLVGYLHKPESLPKKGIVLAHCFTCSKHQRIMRRACDTLAGKGYLVLRFDFSGNGESEGKFEEATYSKEIKDMDSAISFMEKQGVSWIGILGHSMGADVSILHAPEDNRIQSLCILGASASTTNLVDIFPKEVQEKIKKEGKTRMTLFGKEHMITQEFLEDTKKHNIPKALKNMDKPLCIIHGDNDAIIPVASAQKLYALAQEPKELHIIKGADHLFSEDTDFTTVLDIVIAWFDKTSAAKT